MNYKPCRHFWRHRHTIGKYRELARGINHGWHCDKCCRTDSRCGGWI